MSSLESISKCAVDSVRVAELDNERAQRAKMLTCAKENCSRSCLT